MNFIANKGKKVKVNINGEHFLRHAIKTKFINIGENYIELLKEYVLPIYQEGDIISLSEKVIALCQKKIVRREDIKVCFWAKLLSKFASHPTTGIGVGEAIKMQYAINKVGLLKVILASIVSAITKLFGKKGFFYKIVGKEVSGLDGFYDNVWEEYRDIGIEMPENPICVCNEIKEKLDITCMIVDANDLGQEILGVSEDLNGQEKKLKELIKDNPAGQGRECTPFILIRKKKEVINKNVEIEQSST